MNLRVDKYSSHFRYIFLALLYFVVCLVVLNTFMDLNGFRGDSERFGFNKMMTYTAERPFAYRVLTPVLINGIVSLIPESAIAKLEKDLLHDSNLLRYVDVTENWDAVLSAKYHLTYFYLFLCLLIAIYALRKLTGIICNPPAAVLDFAPALAFIFLPMTFIHGGYMYDFPELMFYIVTLVLILKSRWPLYYLIFPLAVLNKEVGFFIILFFAVLKFREMPKPVFWRHIAAQLIIGLAILVFIRILFADNPEPLYSSRIITNLLFWINPLSYFKFYETYAPLLGIPRGGNIISLFLLIFAVLYKWKEKPVQIRTLFKYSAIVMLPLFLFLGNRDEIRGLALLFPLIYLLAVPTFIGLYNNLSSAKK
ncbi:MAG: hypothetical protein DRP51_04285 [Candidatus Zixiibacteriota bacterium]|nr:MAG: hypothetical protein DRP51_04285 [candidate division Zixibacteria bacterium]HHI02241.1 hypothetical protein [candidate division Zixibacteria bacterium]